MKRRTRLCPQTVSITVNGLVVVVGGATATPTHAVAVEKAIMDKQPTEEIISEAADKMDIEAVMGDAYASSEYRAHLAKGMAKRALMLAVQRAGG